MADVELINHPFKIIFDLNVIRSDVGKLSETYIENYEMKSEDCSRYQLKKLLSILKENSKDKRKLFQPIWELGLIELDNEHEIETFIGDVEISDYRIKVFH